MEVCISHRAGPPQITWGTLLFLLGSLNKQPHLLPGERKDGKGPVCSETLGRTYI